jgi:hypothetical protein
MPERYDNIIYKPFFRSKTIIATLSNMTRTGLIVCMEDFKKAPGMDYVHIEDTEVGETTIADIATTTYPVGSNAISIISLNAS